ncbi:MAG: type I restriction enzyme HsdR N-terminal domain-containing protein [Prevotellaceae bacterium]|jgi:hypothetical protein|nr:type I restriction enzyme HsdR N-terminal domain-containing protein [Prevotellaceae bacterium]
MDFKDSIKQLAERVDKVKDSLTTEEATKTALVLPFLQAMGYDVFNPAEVLPEFTCDIGTKKGEKIDYAIFKEGKPIILVECKHWEQNLNLHDNQLLRYFHVSNAKFGVLTNGIIYRFYTDLESPNKMDEKPFLDINLSELKINQIEELKKFHKMYFDLDNILSSANELKYMGELSNILTEEFTNPSSEFVKLFVRQIYSGVVSAKILQQFTPLIKQSITNFINDAISDRLQSALKPESNEQLNSVPIDAHAHEEQSVEIVTTDEELEAFYIIKSILRTKFPAESITYRDARSYFSVFLNKSVLCRLYFNSSSDYLAFQGEGRKEIKHKLETLDDIYQHSEQILSVAESL